MQDTRWEEGSYLSAVMQSVYSTAPANRLGNIYIYIYIYIYIFTNLLSTSIYGYQEKRKKKPPRNRDNNILNYRPVEIKYIIGEKIKRKKEKANFVTPVAKKIKRYAISWSKEK